MTVDDLRNGIIDRLMTITNKEYLAALHQLLSKSTANDVAVPLTDEQRVMLQMSDMDISGNRLLTQEELDRRDLEWLRGK